MPTPEVAGVPLASPTVRKTDVAVLGMALLGAVTEFALPGGDLTRSLRRLKMQKKEMVGSGSVGYVYRAVYNEKTDVAVKVLTEVRCLPRRGPVRRVSPRPHFALVLLLRFASLSNKPRH
eukprot:1264905-Pyramimonas_sp.AAC.1